MSKHEALWDLDLAIDQMVPFHVNHECFEFLWGIYKFLKGYVVWHTTRNTLLLDIFILMLNNYPESTSKEKSGNPCTHL